MDYTAKIVASKQAGYTDEQIVEFLGKQDKRVQVSLDAGHTPTEILAHLVNQPRDVTVMPEDQRLDVPAPGLNSRDQAVAKQLIMDTPESKASNREVQAELAPHNRAEVTAALARETDPGIRKTLTEQLAAIDVEEQKASPRAFAAPGAPIPGPAASQGDIRKFENVNGVGPEERTFEQMQGERAALERGANELRKAIANLERTVPLREGAAQDAALAKIEQFKKTLADTEAKIERTGVGTTGRNVGGAIGGVLGAAIGATAGTGATPGVGTVVGGGIGSAAGTALGSAAGASWDLDRAKRNAVVVKPEDASQMIKDGVIEDVLWDVGGNALFFGAGRVYKILSMTAAEKATLKQAATDALAKKRAGLATAEGTAAVNDVMEGTSQTPSQQLLRTANEAQNKAKAVEELVARSGGTIPSVGQVTDKPSFLERTARSLHGGVYQDSDKALQAGAEQMREELVSPMGQPSRKELGQHLLDTAKKLEVDVRNATRPAFDRANELQVKVDMSPMVDRIDAELAKDAASAKRLLSDGEKNDLMALRKDLEDRMGGEGGFTGLFDAEGNKIKSTAKPTADFTAEGALDFISGNKARTRKLSDGTQPSKYYTGILGDLNDVAEAGYEHAAKTSGNKKVYDDLIAARARYKELMGVKYDDAVGDALGKNPEDVGRLFWQNGNVSEIDNLKNLTDLAVKQGTMTKEQQRAMHADWMRGYLAESVQSLESGAAWGKAMRNPGKKDTFDAMRALDGTGQLANAMEVFEQAAKVATNVNANLAKDIGTFKNLPTRAIGGAALGFVSIPTATIMLSADLLLKAIATASVNSNKGIMRDLMMVMRAGQSGASMQPVRAAGTRIAKFIADNNLQDSTQPQPEGQQ